MRLAVVSTLLGASALLVPAALQAQPYPQAEAQTLALAQETIALRSVQGEGNKTAEVAQAFRQALLAGGWSDKDIEIVPVDDTAYLVATWPGSDPSLKPVLISAHMDVVEAKPEDWERDPFTPVVENGYLFGRGASDTKFEASLAVAALIELRRQGFKPKRSIVVAYSGDEETTMKTSRMITERFKDAELVINIDGASGTLSEETGEPLYWTWQGAEKSYVDFELEVTNPGGHSSAPRPENAIAQLAGALKRIGAYHFTPELNDITRAYFEEAAALQPDPALASAMRTFARDPADAEAAAILRADPSMAGKIGTTCVPTMVSGGHAPNALPQRATAVVNCRVFPGHTWAEVQAELEQVSASPQVTFREITGDTSTIAPASPMRPGFISVFEKGIRKAWGDVPIFPSQSSGASDSMWFRAAGVSSYGASASMTKDSDDFSHGLNERIALVNIRPGITYYMSVMTDLASR